MITDILLWIILKSLRKYDQHVIFWQYAGDLEVTQGYTRVVRWPIYTVDRIILVARVMTKVLSDEPITSLMSRLCWSRLGPSQEVNRFEVSRYTGNIEMGYTDTNQ